VAGGAGQLRMAAVRPCQQGCKRDAAVVSATTTIMQSAGCSMCQGSCGLSCFLPPLHCPCIAPTVAPAGLSSTAAPADRRWRAGRLPHTV
jgi:hypothetical protein